MEKLNVCIVFGGKSGEHEVSINSAKSIYNVINKQKYNVSLLGVSKKGQMAFVEPSNFERLISIDDQPSSFSRLSKLEEMDVIFPIIHGSFGEDGCLQGFFEIFDKAYVGPGVLGSALGMDKDVMKRLMKQAGIKTSNFVVLRKNNLSETNIQHAIDTLKFPIFVKPANMGSSVGVSKANNKPELMNAINEALKYDTKILLEEYIKGREIEVSVLGNNEPIASVPGEVIPNHDFYSYKAKYLDENGAGLDIPANLPEEKIKEFQKLAVEIFQCLECYGLSRVDFFLKDNGEIYVNEINTLPGFTKISMYPKLWGATGIEYSDLIDKLIEFALEKKHEKDSLKRSFSAN